MKRICFLVLCTLSNLSALNVIQKNESKLDALARKYWTDKAPIAYGEGGHDYVEHYERHFSHLRYEKIKLLEIGFGSGGSAQMWEEYFPYAEIHYLNIPASDYEQYGYKVSHRTHLHVGDQRNVNDLQNLINATEGDFDIIIDDGGHDYEHQYIAFTILFRHLKSGGCYVIEDICGSYWSSLHESARQKPTLQNPSTVLFLKSFIDDINYVAARNISSSFAFCPAHILNNLNYYQKNIYSIFFYSNICFIGKR